MSATSCEAGFSILNESSNSWKPQFFGPNISDSYDKYNNYLKEKGFFQLVTPKFNIPIFYYISPLHNNQYIVVASDGVYSLKKDQFPVRFFEQKIEPVESGLYTKAVFSQDDKYFVVITPVQYGGGDSNIVYDLTGYVIDFTNSSFATLRLENRSTQEKLEELNNLLESSKFKEDSGRIYLTDSSTNKALVSVNLSTKKLQIVE